MYAAILLDLFLEPLQYLRPSFIREHSMAALGPDNFLGELGQFIEGEYGSFPDEIGVLGCVDHKQWPRAYAANIVGRACGRKMSCFQCVEMSSIKQCRCGQPVLYPSDNGAHNGSPRETDKYNSVGINAYPIDKKIK